MGARAAAAVPVVLALAYLLANAGPYDDAYITYRYAQNIAAGHGFVFNPGEARVDGFTSFGWTVLLAGLAALRVPLPSVAIALSIGCALLLVAACARLYRAFTGDDGPWRLAPGILVAANATLAFHGATGMETALFAVLVDGAVLLALGDDRRPAIGCGLALAAAALVRPEGPGYAALVVAALATERTGRRRAAVVAGTFAALYVPYFLWRWHLFGYPFPNTFYAKASPSGALWPRGLAYVESYLTTHLFWLAAAAVVALGRAHRWPRWTRLCAAVGGGAIADAVLVGGDNFAYHRFLLPAIPIGAVALVAAGRTFAPHVRDAYRRLGVYLFGGLVLWTFALPFWPCPSIAGTPALAARDAQRFEARLNDLRLEVGRWLERTAPPSTLVAANVAGIIPFVSKLPAIDMLGLNDAHIAHRPIALGRAMHGHEKNDPAYIVERRPDLVLLSVPIVTRAPLDPADVADGLHLAGDRALYASPAFQAGWQQRNVEIAPGHWLATWVRRDRASAR